MTAGVLRPSGPDFSQRGNPAAWDSSHLPRLNCNGCRKCCLGDSIRLGPADDPRRYRTRKVNGRHELAKGKDGNCIYLGERGCTIQSRKPLTCQLYDCRIDYEMTMRSPPSPGRSARLAIPAVRQGRALYPVQAPTSDNAVVPAAVISRPICAGEMAGYALSVVLGVGVLAALLRGCV